MAFTDGCLCHGGPSYHPRWRSGCAFCSTHILDGPILTGPKKGSIRIGPNSGPIYACSCNRSADQGTGFKPLEDRWALTVCRSIADNGNRSLSANKVPLPIKSPKIPIWLEKRFKIRNPNSRHSAETATTGRRLSIRD